MIKGYLRKLKGHFHEVLKIKTNPSSIALGFAIGTAVAVLPTFGFGVFMGLLIVLVFKKVSKISLFASLAVWNPLILASLYGLSYKIGDFLLKGTSDGTYNFWISNEFFNYTKRFLLGNIILATILTIFSYFIIYFLAKKYQKKYEELVD